MEVIILDFKLIDKDVLEALKGKSLKDSKQTISQANLTSSALVVDVTADTYTFPLKDNLLVYTTKDGVVHSILSGKLEERNVCVDVMNACKVAIQETGFHLQGSNNANQFWDEFYDALGRAELASRNSKGGNSEGKDSM